MPQTFESQFLQLRRKVLEKRFSRMNDKQREAVFQTEGPVLILAGAGSGKTTVVVNRIANMVEYGNAYHSEYIPSFVGEQDLIFLQDWLDDKLDDGDITRERLRSIIADRPIKPWNILAITFTNKAAGELKERLEAMLGEQALDIQASTFHSACMRILRREINNLGFDRSFTVYDTDDSVRIIRDALKELEVQEKVMAPKAILASISAAKDQMLSPQDVLRNAAGDYKEEVIAKVYDFYQKRLKAANALDFDDIIIFTVKLFQQFPEILEKYRNRFRYIMVDEYQDTNNSQFLLVSLLAGGHNNICVVGDDDQSIYKFRGATIENILNFEKDYPEAKTILLEENYRSTKNILNAANSVIKNNRERKDKNLWSNNEEGDKIKYKKVSTEKEEASFVVGEIKDLISKGVKEEAIAVLYRTNAQSRTIEEELLKKNIKYRVVGSFYFYNRKEIKDLLCYLRLINNHKDDVSLLRIINTPKRGIGEKTIDNLTTLAEDADISIYEAITTGKELTFKELIEELTKDSEKMSLTELVDDILDKSGIRKELESSKLLEDEIRLENLNEFKGVTKSYEEEFGSASLEDFLEEISLVSDITEHQDSDGRVSLMTVHSVKGLEFDYVFIVGMEEGIFPHYNAINDGSNSAIEEERRLCYVAITRAKKKLYITSADTRMLFGNTSRNMPSRFINEIDKEYIEVEGIKPLTKMVSNIKKKIDKNAEYTVGEHIVHTEFGEGVVIGVDKSILTVAFPHPIGIRKLMKGHPNIKKI